MSLQCWSEELAHLGFHAPYRGEGVASYTHQVVMALVKTNANEFRATSDLPSWRLTGTSALSVETRATVFQSVAVGSPSASARLWRQRSKFDASVVQIVTATSLIWSV